MKSFVDFAYFQSIPRITKGLKAERCWKCPILAETCRRENQSNNHNNDQETPGPLKDTDQTLDREPKAFHKKKLLVKVIESYLDCRVWVCEKTIYFVTLLYFETKRSQIETQIECFF